MYASLSLPFLQITTTERQLGYVSIPCLEFSRKYLSLKTGCNVGHHPQRSSNRAIHAVVSGVNNHETLPSSSTDDDFIVTSSSVDGVHKLKFTVEVSGSKTQEIYDEVFSKMVADAQPIPGFRRVKGGKTPDIPKDILLEILGPSNVFQQVIRKIISCAIFEYAAKEGLTVGKDLEIEQSLEDLVDGFELGNGFRFDAIVQCHNDQK